MHQHATPPKPPDMSRSRFVGSDLSPNRVKRSLVYSYMANYAPYPSISRYCVACIARNMYENPSFLAILRRQSMGFLYSLCALSFCICSLHFVNSIGHENRAANEPAIPPQTALDNFLIITSVNTSFFRNHLLLFFSKIRM